MKYCCNPININYRYQFNADPRNGGKLQICREAADPSMILFRGRYYIFASMTLGVWISDDLVSWENRRLPDTLPLYDYAPDVRVVGDWVFFCASNREHACDFWRTKDILNGPYERIEGSFPFWDPNLFYDDDGRIYFYWGCSNMTPIYGAELDPETLQPIGERKELVFGDPLHIGYERVGENNSTLPASDEEVEAKYRAFINASGVPEEHLPADVRPLIRGMFTNRPYIEGAWMDKHNGRYYLQYAAPGTQYNTYSDGVYVGESPLGPFTLAENSPYSYKPGGFMPGAGHGSTMRDKQGNLWHTATMRISVNHDFERRVGIWPAGLDPDGELFCNQRYGDWPMPVSGGRDDPWRDPPWMLLSVHKAVTASSSIYGHEPELAAEENVQTWWKAETNSRDEWLCVDLGKALSIHAIQVNFADDSLDLPCPGEIRPGSQARYIEETDHVTQWKLEGSLNGADWFVIEDKSDAVTDLSHDLIVRESGFDARFVRLSNIALPYGQAPCVSGLRIFGLESGKKPAPPLFHAVRKGDLDLEVTIHGQPDALGWNILFGSSPEKLYHSSMTFKHGTLRIGALVSGRDCYVRVDAFNGSGITKGNYIKAE
ncbi:MAG: family 43 glycosylhydrolase [Lachnospiraceae bacterium]|nr:family 43 glycosylhydrolase [Lachnospiraceae bacterium]